MALPPNGRVRARDCLGPASIQIGLVKRCPKFAGLHVDFLESAAASVLRARRKRAIFSVRIRRPTCRQSRRRRLRPQPEWTESVGESSPRIRNSVLADKGWGRCFAPSALRNRRSFIVGRATSSLPKDSSDSAPRTDNWRQSSVTNLPRPLWNENSMLRKVPGNQTGLRPSTRDWLPTVR